MVTFRQFVGSQTVAIGLAMLSGRAQPRILHKAERPLSSAEASASISLCMRQNVADKVVICDHPKIAESSNTLEFQLSANVKNRLRELDSQRLSTAPLSLLLVVPVHSQQHVRTYNGLSPLGEQTSSIPEIRAISRFRGKIQRDGVLEALLFAKLRG